MAGMEVRLQKISFHTQDSYLNDLFLLICVFKNHGANITTSREGQTSAVSKIQIFGWDAKV